MELPNEVPGIKLSKSMIEVLMSKLDQKGPQAISVEGGTWDQKRNMYQSTDSTSGVTTEYTLRKSPFVDKKYAVYEKSYKEMPDGKKTEVVFNETNQEWVKKGAAEKGVNMLQKPKYMSDGVEFKKDASGATTATLRVERAKAKMFKV